MITKEQLADLARKNSVPMHTQERDYIQTMFLFRIYKNNTPLVFKGGTSLKMIHNLPRFSEDLDFNASKENKIEEKLRFAAGELKLAGIEAAIGNKRKIQKGYGMKLKYRGPLYAGSDISKGSIKIDISLRNDMLMKPELKTISSAYPDIQPFLALCMPVEEVFAEKIRALIKRSKPRDIYDVWFLFNSKIKLEKSFLMKKVRFQGLEFDPELIKKDIEGKKTEWKRDLSALLDSPPDFDAVKNNVLENLLSLQ